jgi:peptide/nickel transport system substrate-binding protein
VYSELKLLAKDVPVVPLFFQKGAFAYRPQVYDGWLFVQGTGILDKRSFLRRNIEPSAGSSDPIVPDGSEGTGGGIGLPGIIALGLLAVVLAFLGLGLAGRFVRR